MSFFPVLRPLLATALRGTISPMTFRTPPRISRATTFVMVAHFRPVITRFIITSVDFWTQFLDPCYAEKLKENKINFFDQPELSRRAASLDMILDDLGNVALDVTFLSRQTNFGHVVWLWRSAWASPFTTIQNHVQTCSDEKVLANQKSFFYFPSAFRIQKLSWEIYWVMPQILPCKCFPKQLCPTVIAATTTSFSGLKARVLLERVQQRYR